MTVRRILIRRRGRLGARAGGGGGENAAKSVAFLHLGPETHGLHRYGALVAQALREAGDLDVTEQATDFNRRGWGAIAAPVKTAWALRRHDAVVISYSPHARQWSQTFPLHLWQLTVVHLGLRRRTLAVLHDVYDLAGRRREGAYQTLNLVLPGFVVVHSDHDRARLAAMPRSERVRVVPLFIEPRSLGDRTQAREQFRVPVDDRVLAMLGWIHPAKNYEAAVATLAQLGAPWQLWLIGDSPDGDPTYLKQLRTQAEELGVADRVTITGYISEAELGARLAAVDIGFCPYHDASASASMSTLLSARRPVVANNFSFAEEIQTAAPHAVTTVSDPTPKTFAAAVLQLADTPPTTGDFDTLVQQRALDAVAAQYHRHLLALLSR